MPAVVYGIMSFHPTHDITVPDPALTASAGVPNACNLCHLDRSANWSIEQAKLWWPERFGHTQLSNDEQFNLPEGPRALFAGDALTRALAAELLGGNGPLKPNPLWAGPFLVEAFADRYPIVRFFAANGLTTSTVQWSAAKPDYLASQATRENLLQRWRGLMVVCPAETRQQAAFLALKLRARQLEVDLEVGE